MTADPRPGVGLDALPLRYNLRGQSAYGAPQLDVPVQLNVNENPYGPSEACVADIAASAVEKATRSGVVTMPLRSIAMIVSSSMIITRPRIARPISFRAICTSSSASSWTICMTSAIWS